MKKILMLVNWKLFPHSDTIVGKIPSPNLMGGKEKYWFFRHLPEKDFIVDVLDFCELPVIHSIERKVIRNYLIQAILAILRSSNYDLIISHGGQSAFLFALLRHALRKTDPPHLLIDVGCLNAGRNRKIELYIVKKALDKIQGIIYHSRFQKAFYAEHFPEIMHKTYYVPFGIDPLFFSSQPYKEKNYILSIGQDYLSRDWKTLVQAYETLKPKTILKIVGLKKLPHTESNIKILPKLDISTLNKIISLSKFVILPLKFLNFSYAQTTLLQCMSLQKSVIVTDVPSISDYVIDEKTAILVKVGDVEDMTQKIKFLLENPMERKKIGFKARRTIIENFNEKNMAKDIFNVVTSLIARGKT